MMYEDAAEANRVKAPPMAVSPAPAFSLLGISKLGDDPRQWFFQIQTSEGRNSLMRLGQVINGWTLERVDGACLVMRKGQEEQTLSRP